ncbi:deoxyribonuclease-1-like [Protopterus annectens]|uniref:deoxyribonuclease-1-like n=1 Tax=Protopterus annectens TaxID=7888 RepID=UPI001CFB6CEE|nr:deoxyribonuclease-1-like [Protopterus annectens]
MVNTLIDLKCFTRKLNLKVWFNQPSDQGISINEGFRKPSTFNPPLNNVIGLFEKNCEKDIRQMYITNKTRNQEKIFNMTKEEQQLLADLTSHTTIRFMKPDKGNGVVIMEKGDYLDAMNYLLLDDTYEESSLNEIKVTYRKIDLLLDDMLYQGQIDEKEYFYMKNEHPMVSNIFGIPKIHKGLINPKFRPIMDGMARGPRYALLVNTWTKTCKNVWRMNRKTLTIPLILVSILQLACSLHICAFNIKAFGDAKMSDPAIANSIVNIVIRCDIALIQEVRDTDLTAVKQLVQKLNSVSLTPYSYVVSDPLGRSTYKEQYLFVYRTQAVAVTGDYHYDDGCEPCGTDTFNREPYVVKFLPLNSASPEFVIVPQHTSPDEAVQEIDALYDVVLDIQDKWKTNNILLMGDFNAGCSYVKPSDWNSIRLRTDSQFKWLIPDDADTTVSYSTSCAYDRIVVSGTALINSVVSGSAVVFNFESALGIGNSEALAVSDHYPVEVHLH